MHSPLLHPGEPWGLELHSRLSSPPPDLYRTRRKNIPLNSHLNRRWNPSPLRPSLRSPWIRSLGYTPLSPQSMACFSDLAHRCCMVQLLKYFAFPFPCVFTWQTVLVAANNFLSLFIYFSCLSQSTFEPKGRCMTLRSAFPYSGRDVMEWCQQYLDHRLARSTA